MARDCTQPWGPSTSSFSLLSTSSAPVSSPQFVSSVPFSVPSSSPSAPASTIQSTPVQSVLSSATVPSTSVSAPVPSELVTPEDGEVVRSLDHSEADAFPPRRPRPRVPSPVDCIKLVLPRVRLGSDSSTVKKLCVYLWLKRIN